MVLRTHVQSTHSSHHLLLPKGTSQTSQTKPNKSNNLNNLNKTLESCCFSLIFFSSFFPGGGKKYDHTSPFIKELQWLKIKQKINFETYINVQGSEWPLPRLFSNILNCRGLYNESRNIFVPRARTNTGVRSMSIRGPNSWNALPAPVTKAASFITP